jgi:hypothetical protein
MTMFMILPDALIAVFPALGPSTIPANPFFDRLNRLESDVYCFLAVPNSASTKSLSGNRDWAGVGQAPVKDESHFRRILIFVIWF